MINYIVYVGDEEAFLDECKKIASTRSHPLWHKFQLRRSGEVHLMFSRTEPFVNGKETLSIVTGLSESDFFHLQSVELLGATTPDRAYKFVNESAQELYERVRGPLETTIVNEVGETQTITQPYDIGFIF